MNQEELIQFVRGMVKCVRPKPRDDAKRAWLDVVELYAVIKAPNDKAHDINSEIYNWTVNAEKVPALAEASLVDGAAHDAALTLAKMHLASGRVLPPSLAKFAISVLEGHAKKPRRETKKYETQVRDEVAFVAVNYLVERGFKVQSVHGDNASSIVFKALKDAGYTVTDEKSVATMYSRQKALQNSSAS